MVASMGHRAALVVSFPRRRCEALDVRQTFFDEREAQCGRACGIRSTVNCQADVSPGLAYLAAVRVRGRAILMHRLAAILPHTFAGRGNPMRRYPGCEVSFGNGDAANAKTNDGRPLAASDQPLQMPETYRGALGRLLSGNELHERSLTVGCVNGLPGSFATGNGAGGRATKSDQICPNTPRRDYFSARERQARRRAVFNVVSLNVPTMLGGSQSARLISSTFMTGRLSHLRSNS